MIKIKKIFKLGALCFLLLLLWGCASHAVISPEPIRKGESVSGISWSMENVFPVAFYRRGLSSRVDIGFRVGLPVYGTGLDLTYTVYSYGLRREFINIAYSLSSNSSFDFTYYSLRYFKGRAGVRTFYKGFRIMYIPSGISYERSFRFGFLGGISLKRFGVELGYFHDFDKGQPFEFILSQKPKNPGAITDFGFPGEHSRLVGMSFSLYFFMKKSFGN